MNNSDRQAHWQNVYATKSEKQVSWYQENPAPSLDLIAATCITGDAAIIDIGGGASRLVDSLLEKGFRRITILDLSTKALDAAKKRLWRPAGGIDRDAADVTTLGASLHFDPWAHRAPLPFLTGP